MQDRRPWFLAFLFSVSAAITGASCTGSIDGPSPGAGTPAGGSANNPGGSSSGTGNSGGGMNMPGTATAEPGRVTMRRLNQTEYDNTVTDLLGTLSHPAAAFLSDTVANGFDNDGDLLTLSPVRLQQYQQAAASLATEALSGTLRTRNLTCDPTAGDTCVRTFVTTMGERAYRRPLTDDEINRYLTLAGKVRTAGGMPDDVINAALQAMLVSPSFLFRPEFDPDPTSLTAHALSPYELASRLSYLVYESMPDDPLYSAAKAGQLTAVKDIQTQLQRMLMDPRSRLSQSYAEQWLGVRNVDSAQPDKTLYPTFSAALGTSMKKEVDLYFDEFVRQNLPVDQLLTSNFTYLDDSLAAHYGVPAVGSTTDLMRVTLSTPQRGGLWGMGALLVATSRGNRTSPVSRGRFTLDALMCAPPPPPPANVQPPSDATITATDERTFLAMHRSDPTCAACHSLMDPIGLALENYDAIGKWRDADHGQKIDASGMLPDGTNIDGRAALEAALAKDTRMPSCIASNLLEYSLGRHLTDNDQPYVKQVAKAPAGGKPGVRDLLMNVVASDAFRMRQGEPVAMGGKQ
ncbi:MAG TPA: DUF1592 domain-containing protein [Polyangia bacterium]|jgi:hypothetical protein|nr:DUF1592 domain-containing protein [Polyangia bacterium]